MNTSDHSQTFQNSIRTKCATYDHQDTNLLEFPQVPYRAPFLEASSSGLDVCCSRWASICHQYEDSMAGNRDGRSCDLIGVASERMHISEGHDQPTIFHAILEHQLGTLLARFPPWCDVPTRRLSTELGQVLVRLIKDGVLLLEAHSLGVLVAVAV